MPGSGGTPVPVRTIPAYPSISRVTTPPPPSSYETELFAAKPPQSYGANLFTPTPSAQPIGERYRDRIKIGYKEYPLVVKRVVATPFGDKVRRADAIYYDDALKSWRVVDDDEDRLNLAKAVEAGRLSVTPMTEWPATS